MTRDEKLDKILAAQIPALNKAIEDEILKLESELPPFLVSLIGSTAKSSIAQVGREEYDRIYNDNDLDILLEFYDSETGKKAIELSLILMSDNFRKKLLITLMNNFDKVMSDQKG